MNAMSMENELLHIRLNAMENTLQRLYEELATIHIPSFEELISSTMDRHHRMKNVILFNLPESNTNSSDDNSSIQDIFYFLRLQFQPLRFTRLGQPSNDPSKPRPIKLCFSEERHVLSIFKTQHNLKFDNEWKNLRFVSDRTKSQRQYMIVLRQELSLRRLNGEPNLSIKYINGIPMIINRRN